MHINVLVEGIIDEAVARRLINETGHQPGVCYGKKGVSYIHQKIRGFNKSAASMPILTLVDFMDTGLKCPPEVTSSWLPHRCANMLCRIVVREIESWILADRNNLSTYLRVASNRVPLDPENVPQEQQRCSIVLLFLYFVCCHFSFLSIYFQHNKALNDFVYAAPSDALASSDYYATRSRCILT